jgi:hypothetical protein
VAPPNMPAATIPARTACVRCQVATRAHRVSQHAHAAQRESSSKIPLACRRSWAAAEAAQWPQQRGVEYDPNVCT